MQHFGGRPQPKVEQAIKAIASDHLLLEVPAQVVW